MTDMLGVCVAVHKRWTNPIIPEFSGFFQICKNAGIILCVNLPTHLNLTDNADATEANSLV